MELTTDLKKAICSLFDVQQDENGVQRVITPLEYPGSGDSVVIRVRPRNGFFQIDENGEAALYASLSGGDVDSDTIQRWSEDLSNSSLIKFSEEVLQAEVKSTSLVAPYIFHVAAAAQQLFALATSHKERTVSDFKERVANVVREIAEEEHLTVQDNVELPIAGGLVADHFIESSVPLIVISAPSATRLLEAEIIHMQYQISKKQGFVLAVAESEKAVGVKQFMRANYYTGKTVHFSPPDLSQLLRAHLH